MTRLVGIGIEADDQSAVVDPLWPGEVRARYAERRVVAMAQHEPMKVEVLRVG